MSVKREHSTSQISLQTAGDQKRARLMNELMHEEQVGEENNSKQQQQVVGIAAAASSERRVRRTQTLSKESPNRQQQESSSSSNQNRDQSLAMVGAGARQVAAKTTTPDQQQQQPQQRHENICAACGKPIKERYLLMALDKQWHEDCLKCDGCNCRLGEVGRSLYTRANKILCRTDFLRIFGQRGHCAACKKEIPPYEMVMRANDLTYHMDCFSCQHCQYRFCVGDQFHLTDLHLIICISCHRDQQQQQQQQNPPNQTTVAYQPALADDEQLDSLVPSIEQNCEHAPAGAEQHYPSNGSYQRQQQQQNESNEVQSQEMAKPAPAQPIRQSAAAAV